MNPSDLPSRPFVNKPDDDFEELFDCDLNGISDDDSAEDPVVDGELDRLLRQVLGTTSAEEHREIAEHMLTQKVHTRLAEALERSRADTRTSVLDGVEARQMEKVFAQIADDRANSGAFSKTTEPPRRSPANWRPRTLIAGFVGMSALAIGVAALWKTQQSASSAQHDRVSQQMITHAGERTSLTLPDGSRVLLGPSSTLTVLDGFPQKHRRILLNGSAYFSVEQKPEQPFVISSGRAQVRVLGTEFGVRHYSDDTDVVVAIREGRVAVSDTTPSSRPTLPIVAVANDIVRVSATGTTITHNAQQASTLLAWTDGRLVFDKTPLRIALPELARWYDVTFQVTDPAIDSMELSGGFSNQSIDRLPEMLSAALDLQVKREGRTIVLSRR